MSGTAVSEAESSKVLTPLLIWAAAALLQPAVMATCCASNAAFGRIAKMKLPRPPAGTVTGVLSAAMVAFVVGSAAW